MLPLGDENSTFVRRFARFCVVGVAGGVAGG
jgi:hypothetical protein